MTLLRTVADAAMLDIAEENNSEAALPRHFAQARL